MLVIGGSVVGLFIIYRYSILENSKTPKSSYSFYFNDNKEFADMGSWWQGKNHKDQDEIDIGQA